MNQLSKLQNIFQDSVLHADNPLSTAWISAKGRAVPEVQLSIYSYAYQARLREVLANDYPAMLNAIGDDHFDQIANDYIKAHPSAYFSLRDFGKHMPEFLLTLINTNKAFDNNKWLHELSIFEWTLGDTFDAADNELFTFEEMASINPEAWPDLRFTIHPSVQCLSLEWNTVEMWQALTSDPPRQVSAEPEPANTWLFWREQLITRYRSVSTEELLALNKLLNGKSFNDICEALTDIIDVEQVPMCAAGFLKDWIAQGLITGIQ